MEYRVIRSRRKTIAIEITSQGEILVRCPSRTTKKEIQQILSSREHWISNHLAKLARQPQVQPLSDAELAALTEKARQVIADRTAYFADLLGVSYGRITIRCQRTRWGSCSAAGNLNFNCLLSLAPPEILDYVVVHELCHRLEMNHSPRFWAAVERILPDCRSRRQWLKDQGGSLIARLPK